MQFWIQKHHYQLMIMLAVVVNVSVASAVEVPLTAEENIELASFRRIASLLPFEKQPPDTLKQALLQESFSLVTDEVDKFGVRTLEFKKHSESLGGFQLSFHVYQHEIEAYIANFISPYPQAFFNKKLEIWQAHTGKKITSRYVSLISNDRLNQEIGDVVQLMQQMPFEKQLPTALIQYLLQSGYRVSLDETDPFGLNKTTLIKENHYKTMSLVLASFNGSLTGYKLDIKGKPMYSSRLGSHGYDDIPLDLAIFLVWKNHKGTDSWSNHGIFIEEEYEDVLQDYYQSVVAGKSGLTAVNVPNDLLVDYATLVSNVLKYSSKDKNFVFDNLGDMASEIEMTVIFALANLLKHNRIDLIENVLDGFNPIARVRAIAKLERLGLADRPVNNAKIAAIFAQNSPIYYCGKPLTSNAYYKLISGAKKDWAKYCLRS